MMSSKESAWQSQQKSTYKTLDRMRKEHHLTDLIIVCDDKEFHVHKLHMCASVGFFAAMFESKMKESKSGKVHLRSIGAETMGIVLDFVYNGAVPDIPEENKELFYNLLHASSMLHIEPLFDYYTNQMYSSMTHTRFLEVIEVAELYDCQNVLEKIYSFLADNFNRVSIQPEFDDLRLSHLKRILRQPELSNGCADVVVKGILKWVMCNEVERSSTLEDLIGLVILDALSTEYINILLSEPLVKDCPAVFNCLMPLALSRVNKPQQANRMLSFGIMSKDGVNTSFMTDFDLQTMTWGKSIQIHFKIELGMTIAAVGDDVYFVGGGGGASDYVPTSNVFKYSCATNVVTFHSALEVAVNQSGAAILHGHLYVVGGRGIKGGKQILMKKVQRINIANGRCTLLASTHDVHNVPNVLPTNPYLYVLGSGSGKNVNLERYDYGQDSWTVVTRLPGDIKWCRASIVQNKLFAIRKWEEKQFHIFDFESRDWEVRNFVGGPTQSNGLWGINGNQYILVREFKTNTLYAYDSQQAKWGKKVIKSHHPWFWTLTVIV